MNIFSAVARELLEAFIFNYRFLPIFIIVVLLIKMQHEKHMSIVTNLSDKPARRIWEILQETIFYGAIIGFVGGVIMVFLGVSFEPVVFEYLLAIMAVLLLINIRFICISYSAGILALIAIIFKVPNINVTSLLALISILHFFESILIYAGAGKNCEPVYIRHRQGIAGAFITKRIWPVPVIFIAFLAQEAGQAMFNTISIDWLTLFKLENIYAGSLALVLDCTVSVLTYNDMAITMPPEKKSREAALWLMIYSVLLFIAAIISRNVFVFELIGAIFALTGHEFIYLYGRYEEMNNNPLFVPVRRGVRVLEALPESNAYKMGIKRGDVILDINNMDVQTEEGIAEALRNVPNYVWVKILCADGCEKILEYKCFPDGVDELGILTVPRENEVTYNIRDYGRFNILKNLVKRFRDNSKSM